MRCTRRLRTLALWYAAQAQPISLRSFKTVCLATPVIRHVALMDAPSTRAPITCDRDEMPRRFIMNYDNIIIVNKSRKRACNYDVFIIIYEPVVVLGLHRRAWHQSH